MIKLVCVEGELKGQVWSFKDNSKYLIGREAACNFPVRDPLLSRQHTLIECTNQEIRVVDLMSRNGTFINNQRLSSPHVLNIGDQLRIGRHLWRAFAGPVENFITMTADNEELSLHLSGEKSVQKEIQPEDNRDLGHFSPLQGAEGQKELRLLWVSGAKAGEIIELKAGKRYNFGRNTMCDVVISDQRISGRHFGVTIDDNLAMVEDYLTTHGIFLNGERVAREVLKVGDVIRAGDQTWQVLAEGETEDTAVAQEKVKSPIRKINGEMVLRLAWQQGQGEGTTLELASGRRHVFGRIPECDFIIYDMQFSRRHFCIVVDDNQALIEEFGQNRVLVNGEAVENYSLQLGDIIEAGQQVWQVIGREDEEIPSSTAGEEQERTDGELFEEYTPAQIVELLRQGKPICGGREPFYCENLVLGPDEQEIAQKYEELKDIAQVEAWFRQNPKVYPGLTLENGRIGNLICDGVRFEGPVRLNRMTIEYFHGGEKQIPSLSGWLKGTHFCHSLEITGCRFADVDIVRAICDKNAIIKECEFLSLANFSSLHCRESLHIARCTFHDEMMMRYSEMDDEVVFSQCSFAKYVDFGRSSFLGYFALRESALHGKGNFRELEFYGDTDVSLSDLAGEMDFSSCVFHGKWTAYNTTWGIANFQGAKFYSRAMFDTSHFRRGGNFSKTTFTDVSWNQCQFDQAVDFQMAKVNGDATFFAVHFAAPVSFIHTRFEGMALFNEDLATIALQRRKDPGYCDWHRCAYFEKNADFTNAFFYRKAVFHQVPFMANADFANAYFAEKVSFQNAAFHQDVYFTNVFCAQALNLREVVVARHLFLDYANINRILDLSNARLCGISLYRAVLDIVVVERHQIENSLLHSGRVPGQRDRLDFSRLKDEFLLLKASFQHRGKTAEEDWAYWQHRRYERKWQTQLYRNAFRDQQQPQAEAEPENIDECMASLASFSHQKAEQLDKIVEQDAQINDTDKLAVREKIANYKLWAKRLKKDQEPSQMPQLQPSIQRATVGLLRNAFVKVFIDWGTGYGTQPLRVVAIALATIFSFAFFYWGASHLLLFSDDVSPDHVLIVFQGPEYGELDPVAIARQSGLVDYLYFSTTTFTTMGFGDTHPNHKSWIRYLVMFEAVLGVFLMTLFVGTFTRKIIR